jgi:hypothetical protein
MTQRANEMDNGAPNIKADDDGSRYTTEQDPRKRLDDQVDDAQATGVPWISRIGRIPVFYGLDADAAKALNDDAGWQKHPSGEAADVWVKEITQGMALRLCVPDLDVNLYRFVGDLFQVSLHRQFLSLVDQVSLFREIIGRSMTFAQILDFGEGIGSYKMILRQHFRELTEERAVIEFRPLSPEERAKDEHSLKMHEWLAQWPDLSEPGSYQGRFIYEYDTAQKNGVFRMELILDLGAVTAVKLSPQEKLLEVFATYATQLARLAYRRA